MFILQSMIAHMQNRVIIFQMHHAMAPIVFMSLSGLQTVQMRQFRIVLCLPQLHVLESFLIRGEIHVVAVTVDN